MMIKFGNSTEMIITILKDYKHRACIDENAMKVKGLSTTDGYHPDLKSKNFANASCKLVPGKKYIVKLIPIGLGVYDVNSYQSLYQISKYKGILVGAQGLTVIDINKLPKGKIYVFFDQKKFLWEYKNRCKVPILIVHSNGHFAWGLHDFDCVFGYGHVLVCFCDMP